MKKVFILGNPRSGTTLFRLMLNAHPEIVAPPESGFLHWWYKKYKDWNITFNASSKLDDFINDLKSSKKIETWLLNYDELKEDIQKANPKDYGELGETVYVFYGYQKRRNFDVIADKNNYYINHPSDLSKIWPDAKYILVIRDCRDVACSYKNLANLITESPYKPKLPTDAKAIAEEWIKNNDNVLRFFDDLSEVQSLTVRYEDIVLDSEFALTKVCNFLDKDFDKAMLDYFLPNTRYRDEPDSTIDWKRKTLEKLDKNNIEKYKRELSKNEVDLINSIALRLLQKFNYPV